MVKKIVLGILLIIVLAFVAGYFYLKSTAPTYSGKISLMGLESEVEVKFDNYGIPHIYADNSDDCYRALGYVHAQDRLFQMEMIKRLSAGRLAEILGPDLVETDKYFRTLGVRAMAETIVDSMKTATKAPVRAVINSYLAGVNHYIKEGKTPIEFSIIGIPKEEFTEEDIYSTLGYMGLGFTKAIQEDPMIDMISKKLGEEYLIDWGFTEAETKAKIALAPDSELGRFIKSETDHHLEKAGIPIWEGSNGWVLSPKKSKSGKVLFANDTHISISQPSVWYEAHLNYPGYEFYGSHLAGVPFGVVGHNRKISFGLTIFPVDILDMYRERQNADNKDQVWVDDHWEELQTVKEVIKVKGASDVIYNKIISRHGPIMNPVSKTLQQNETQPVAMSWSFLQYPTKTLISLYDLNHAVNIDQARNAVSTIDFIGLNVMYGDVEGNIAHWATGKIPIRPSHVNSKTILDGASGKDEILGYYDFSENPQSENPASGFVASANNDPGIVGENYFSGYYCPDNRIKRIRLHLSEKEEWSQEEMKAIQLDEISDDHKEISIKLAEILTNYKTDSSSELYNDAVQMLANWDGGYETNQIEPVIYTKLVYHAMRQCMADELGVENFDAIQSSYLYKGSIFNIVNNANSIWWDNVSTKDKIEKQDALISKALNNTISDLSKQLGEDLQYWTWDRVHTMEHVHPIGRKKPFDKFFNVGPFSHSGGNDVPNKMMYNVDSTGLYKTSSTPALRILIDFDDVEASENINPTGQSGNPMSPHYDDQAKMFVEGIYRPQLMNHKKIDKQSRILRLLTK